MIEKKIAQYIDNERLFPINARIIVALSGGADSVALLRILHTLGYDCEAAHCFICGEQNQTGTKRLSESYVKQ